jgi:L-seryl-tRNA(Ser) seleniumtransferase
LVKVHRSNFVVAGFVADVPVRDLVPLAAEHGLPIVHDLGSGLLISLESVGLAGEPTAGEAVREGATVVVMSGDKLLGGPQAGIVVGTKAAIAKLKKHPLARAVRVDKLTIAALGATLALYRDPERAFREVPTLALLSVPLDTLRGRAEQLVARVSGTVKASVVETKGEVGAGAFPTKQIPSFGVALEGRASAIEEQLRLGELPVIGRIINDRVVLDLRSVPAAHDDRLATAVTTAIR